MEISGSFPRFTSIFSLPLSHDLHLCLHTDFPPLLLHVQETVLCFNTMQAKHLSILFWARDPSIFSDKNGGKDDEVPREPQCANDDSADK